MVGTRQLQKEKTRTAIIAAAFGVYSRQGFSAPTSAIARAARVSHGTIFVHFPTVESLLVCLLDVFARDITAELHCLSGSGGLARLLDMHISVLVKYEAFYRRLLTETAYLPEEVRNTFIVIQSAVSVHFLQALKNTANAGKIKKVPFPMLFNTWLGLVHYYLVNGELFAPGKSVLRCHKNALVECFMALIKK